MSSTVVDSDPQIILSPESDGTNGTAAPTQADWPVPEFKYRMEDHPLWQDYLAELEANRQADIAEANRLADLELDAQEPPRVETRGSEVPSVQGTRKREAGG